jgi:hypothetical protein
MIETPVSALSSNDPAVQNAADEHQDRKRAFGDYVGELLINRDFSEVANFTGQIDGAFLDWFCEKLYCGDDDIENHYHMINREWHENSHMWRTKTAYELADDYFDYLEDGE